MSGRTFQPEWPQDGRGCLRKEWDDSFCVRRWLNSYLWRCWKIPSHSALEPSTVWGQKLKFLAKYTRNAAPLIKNFPLSTNSAWTPAECQALPEVLDVQAVSQSVFMELAWGRSGTHIIISDGPIKWSIVTRGEVATLDTWSGKAFLRSGCLCWDQNAKSKALPTNWWGGWDLSVTQSKIGREPTLPSYTKVNSKWIKYVHVSSKTVKVLKYRCKFSWPRTSQRFLIYDTKTAIK